MGFGNGMDWSRVYDEKKREDLTIALPLVLIFAATAVFGFYSLLGSNTQRLCREIQIIRYLVGLQRGSSLI